MDKGFPKFTVRGLTPHAARTGLAPPPSLLHRLGPFQTFRPNENGGPKTAALVAPSVCRYETRLRLI